MFGRRIELQQVLDAELAERFAYVYDVSPGGNFEGKNILHLPLPIAQCAKMKGWDADELAAQMAAGAKAAACRARQARATGQRRQDASQLERSDDSRDDRRRSDPG